MSGKKDKKTIANAGATTKKKRTRTVDPSEFKRSKRGWTNEIQEEFLLLHVAAYRVCQASKKFNKFWVEVEREFAKKWPVPELTDGEKDEAITQKDKDNERKKVSEQYTFSN